MVYLPASGCLCKNVLYVNNNLKIYSRCPLSSVNNMKKRKNSRVNLEQEKICFSWTMSPLWEGRKNVGLIGTNKDLNGILLNTSLLFPIKHFIAVTPPEWIRNIIELWYLIKFPFNSVRCTAAQHAKLE